MTGHDVGRKLLAGPEELSAFCPGPTQLGNSAIHGFCHPGHGVQVLFALLLQLAILEPFVERLGVHELLVPFAHQRVEVVRRVLLLSQLLFPPL